MKITRPPHFVKLEVRFYHKSFSVLLEDKKHNCILDRDDIVPVATRHKKINFYLNRFKKDLALNGVI